MAHSETRSIATVTDTALAWPRWARDAVIRTASEYQDAAQLLLRIKRDRRAVEEVIGPVVEAAHAAHKETVALRKRADDPLTEAERVLKGAMTRYRQAQREADEQDRQQLEAEAKKVARATGSEPQPVLVASSVPDSPNIRVTRRWSVEVTDEAALITAAARNRALRKLLKVDLTALRRHVQATQGEGKIPGVTVTDTETLAVVTNGEG